MKYLNTYRKSFGMNLTLIQNALLLIKKLPFSNKYSQSLSRYKNMAVQTWLEKKYDYVIARYKDMSLDGGKNITADCPIYVYWDRGFIDAPDVVKLCCKQMEKYKGDHSVIYLCNNNLQQYIDLPDKIYEKYKTGQIGKAHFSDIVRFTLLSCAGGVFG